MKIENEPRTEELLICAAFLALGFDDVLRDSRYAPLTSSRFDGIGYVEVVSRLVADAPMIEQSWLDMSEEQRNNWPTVWSYEVVEEYGMAWTKAFLLQEPWDGPAELAKIIASCTYI